MRCLFFALLLLSRAVPADADTGCDEFDAHLSDTGHVVLVSPGGTAAALADQGVVVFVEILDCALEPVAGFPGQDIWLDSATPGELGLCAGGTTADANTDANGTTTFSGALAAGGSTSSGTTFVVSGWRMDHRVVLDLHLVSPDLDGDLDVDIADFTSFGLDFGQSGVRRSDLEPDGVVDLGDFAAFGRHYGESCP